MSQQNPSEAWRGALVERIRVEAQPPEKFSHQARLYALAKKIASSLPEDADDDVLFAAAWSHDLGVFLGHRPVDPVALSHWNSTAYTVAHAAPLLLECGYPEHKVAAAVECIRTHEAHGAPPPLSSTLAFRWEGTPQGVPFALPAFRD